MKNAILSIEKYNRKGVGIGKLASGKQVEVIHSVVGDQLDVLLKSRKKKGRIQEILSPSENRTAPRCAHAHICGGCTWQQKSYQAQLAYKQEVIQKLFMGFSSVEIFPILGMEDPFYYRNKMEFSFSENAAGTKFCGLMIAGASKYVHNVEICHLVRPWFSEALQSARLWFETSAIPAYQPQKNRGSLQTLMLREGMRTGEKMAVLTVREPIDPTGFIEKMRPFCSTIYLCFQDAEKGRPTRISYELLHGKAHITEILCYQEQNYRFHIGPKSFFQPNTFQAEKLYQIALQFIEKKEVVMDLYSGTGTIAALAAKTAGKVIAIEQNPEAVEDAKRNFQENQIENVTVFAGDVGAFPVDERVDTVLLDPPRMGLDQKALRFVLQKSPKKIIYISCNPYTQKDNIEEFVQAGYRLKQVLPVDQFPHTYHIENVAYLER